MEANLKIEFDSLIPPILPTFNKDQGEAPPQPGVRLPVTGTENPVRKTVEEIPGYAQDTAPQIDVPPFSTNQAQPLRVKVRKSEAPRPIVIQPVPQHPARARRRD